MNIRELADQAGLKTYDTALPMQWYDDVHAKIGLWPQHYGVVWCYDGPTTWGEPYPLTERAKIVLTAYARVTGANYRYLNVETKEL